MSANQGIAGPALKRKLGIAELKSAPLLGHVAPYGKWTHRCRCSETGACRARCGNEFPRYCRYFMALTVKAALATQKRCWAKFLPLNRGCAGGWCSPAKAGSCRRCLMTRARAIWHRQSMHLSEAVADGNHRPLSDSPPGHSCTSPRSRPHARRCREGRQNLHARRFQFHDSPSCGAEPVSQEQAGGNTTRDQPATHNLF